MNIRDDSDLPIILVSEDEDINMLIKAFDNGANDYFTVPFNANIFAAKLNAIVRRRTWDSKAN
jgi:PleD family two-component response regulator